MFLLLWVTSFGIKKIRFTSITLSLSLSPPYYHISIYCITHTHSLSMLLSSLPGSLNGLEKNDCV